MAWSDLPPIPGSAKPLVGAAPVARPPEGPARPALGEGDRLVAGGPSPVGHADGQLTARDGAAIAYRSSVPALQSPKAIVVMQQGTYGRPEFFDGMGEALAQRGVQSYALGSRVHSSDDSLHADDLQRVVAMARAAHPGVPVVVMGVSLGAAIALDWRATHNPEGLPVVALSPVVVPRYLGPRDLARVAGGLLSGKLAAKPVHSPMSAGKALTTNPLSPEAKLHDAASMTVPASLFGDVTKMTARVALRAHRLGGPLFVATAGADEVALNASTRAFVGLLRAQDKRVQNFPGLAHDLSQEWHDPRLVGALGDWVLGQVERAAGSR